ncbi:restriction endonuclease subunit S [Celeribacter sp.]|uniref:restriction endonuclease subunit S n=1 Tax=Celeribacter sp. TaxID=1890673 RepID=UPI003A93A3B4
MEGLEASINTYEQVLDNKDWRVDSDFWTKEPYRNPDLSYVPIGDHLTKSQYGISILMHEDGGGVPIYRMNEMHDMLCDYTIMKTADVTDKEKRLFSLHDRDVLFNRTNSYQWVGRTGLYKGNEGARAIFASYLVRFRTDEAFILPEFLTAFLSCKYGQQEVKRRSRQSINQTNVNPEEVKEILIPLLKMGLQDKLKDAFDIAHEAHLAASEKINEAQQTLLDALGLANWTPPEPLGYTARASDAFAAGRWDAQYFRPLFVEVEQRLLATGRAVELGTILDINNRGRQPDYSDEGLPVVNSKHVRTNKVVLGDDNRRAVGAGSPVVIEKGDVLVNGTGVGTIGRAAAFLHEQSALPDNHVTVLRTSRVDPIYLAVFLNSLLGQLQIERHIKGSSGQIELYPNDIAKIVFWDAPDQVQTDVRDAVLSAFREERRAQDLLDAAKRAVEIAIEDGEPAALDFLDSLEEAS